VGCCVYLNIALRSKSGHQAGWLVNDTSGTIKWSLETTLAIGLRLLAKLASPSREPEQLMKDIANWLRQNYPDLMPEIKHGTIKASPAIFCRLHPGAEEVELSLVGREHLVASGSTSAVGPGYHIFLASLLKDWARDFQASWQQLGDELGEYADETGYFFTGDEQQVFVHMTRWLQSLAKVFFDGRLDPGSTAVALSMSSQTHFESDKLAITPLGPRDRKWMYQTSQDGARGKDFFVWWEPGLNAEYYLGRALILMWRTVRWRRPVSDAEGDVLKTVVDSLAKAYKLDPTLPYPWAEWRQILELLDAAPPDEELVIAHAEGTPTIGYRRGKVTETLTGGWRIRIPGSFSEFEFDQNNDRYALDPPREIWFTSFGRAVPLTDKQFESSKNQLKESKFDRMEEGDRYAATATISKKVRESGEDYFMMNTLNVSPAAQAVCTFVYSQVGDEDWAFETWKSLRPPSSQRVESSPQP
jgi:hypothetical protein